jgi:dolichyl-phosphate beta-glucosyltransferase
VPLRTAGFAFDVELMANCLRLGAAPTEIPVHWRDMPNSTFSVRRHSAAAFRDVVSLWLRPAAVDACEPARGWHPAGAAT